MNTISDSLGRWTVWAAEWRIFFRYSVNTRLSSFEFCFHYETSTDYMSVICCISTRGICTLLIIYRFEDMSRTLLWYMFHAQFIAISTYIIILLYNFYFIPSTTIFVSSVLPSSTNIVRSSLRWHMVVEEYVTGLTLLFYCLPVSPGKEFNSKSFNSNLRFAFSDPSCFSSTFMMYHSFPDLMRSESVLGNLIKCFGRKCSRYRRYSRIEERENASSIDVKWLPILIGDVEYETDTEVRETVGGIGGKGRIGGIKGIAASGGRGRHADSGGTGDIRPAHKRRA